MSRVVCSGGLRYPGFRLVKAGEQLRAREYTIDIPWRPTPFTGTAEVERVLAEWERGATIRPPGPPSDATSPCRLLPFTRGTLGHPAQANAYYTPRAAQGLPVHPFTHDVFVLQIAGEGGSYTSRPRTAVEISATRRARRAGRDRRGPCCAGRHALPSAWLAPRAPRQAPLTGDRRQRRDVAGRVQGRARRARRRPPVSAVVAVRRNRTDELVGALSERLGRETSSGRHGRS